MSERFYKIGNTWYPWQTAHGLYGYTKTPTIRITYISTSQATWGQPESGYGFFDGDASEPQNGSYFHTSTWGWFDADTMAKTIWLMPSECEIDDIFFENDGEISPGARLIIDPNVSIDEEDWRYLVASVRNLGWHTLDEWEELGWVLSDPNTLYFGGDFSGNNIRMESVDGGGGLIEKYASYKALFELRGWEPGGLFIDKPRMMGICGVLTETSDSVVQVEVPKLLSVGRIEFTGSLAEGGIPESGVVEEYDPRTSIEINLGIRFDPSNAQWLAKTFDADEWWWSGILSSSDLSVLRNFGCGYLPTNNVSYAFAGNFGALKYEGEKYEYRLLSMFSDVGSSPVAFDVSNFFFKRLYTDGNSSQYNGALLINSINAFATAVKSYRLKIIDKDPGAIYVLCGFKYQSGNWVSVTFAGVGSDWWAGILYADDQAKLQELGLISDTSYPHDEILYSNAYNYECVAMYSDMGVTSVQFDPSNFYIDKATSYPCISIFSRAAFSTPVMTWVCRITRKPAPADYFEIDLGLRWDVNSSGWLSKTFSNNDWWWAGILSNEDLVALRAFGGDIIEAGPSDGKFAGLIGALAYDEAFDYELVDMFSSIGTGSVTFDKTNFNLVKNTSQSSNYSNSLLIASIYAFSTACKTYRVRITRKPTSIFPSVTTINVSLSALGQSKSLGNDETSALYNSSTGYSQVLYDTSKIYTTVHMSANGVVYRSGFPLENEYGLVAVRNKTGSTLTISGGIIAQCDDVTASVIIVFNSSNEAFNAFKYTSNGIDHYYVLDDVQTDWTDDLESIGYIKSTTYTNPVTNNVYAKWRGNSTSNPNYKNYFSDINGSRVGSFYDYGTYMNKFYLNIPDDDYVSDTITGVTAGTRYFKRASSSSFLGDSTNGVLILNKDSGGWYVILSFYFSDISDGNYALDGSITLYKKPATTCFFDQNGSKTNIVLSYLWQYRLYLNNGDVIPYSSSASLLGVYAADGTQVSGTFELISMSGYLAIRCTSANVTAAYCEISMGS